VNQLSYRIPFERVAHLQADLADAGSPVVAAHRVFVARAARTWASVVAAAMIVGFHAIAFARAFFARGPEIDDPSLGIVAMWTRIAGLAATIAVPAIVLVAVAASLRARRIRATQRAFGEPGDTTARMAKLLVLGDRAVIEARAQRLERKSIAAPLIAFALLVTTACLVALCGSDAHPAGVTFLTAICVLPVIVGSAMAWRFASFLAKHPAVEWSRGPGALSTVLAITGTTAVCSFFLLGIPGIVALVASGIAVPLAYRWARRTIAAERAALGLL
jgi:hypothetical protein